MNEIKRHIALIEEIASSSLEMESIVSRRLRELAHFLVARRDGSSHAQAAAARNDRVLRFDIPGDPVPKKRARHGKNGRVYTPKETRNFEQSVALYAQNAIRDSGFRPAFGKERVSLSVITRPPKDGRKLGDLSNYFKSIEDGLNGVAYKDDKQITAILGARVEDGEPRTQVILERLDDPW